MSICARVGFTAFVAAAIIGCGSAKSSTGADKSMIVVSTTNTVATDLVSAIGGDNVRVVSLVKPGADPHDHEPTAADLKTLAESAVIVRNGAGLEPWFDDAAEASSATGTVVTLADGVALRQADGEDDPHVWHNPRNVQIMASRLADSLAAADPVNAARYRERGAAFDRELLALDREIEAQLASITSRNFVSNHDAFGYFCDRYQLTVVGSVIPGFDTQADLSAADVDSLVADIRRTGAKAIFTEAKVPAKAAEAIAKDAGIRLVQGDTSLYGDGLGPVGSPAATYLTMMRHNATTIANALT
jgi:ABC-type Zn uptake system ZnuABC Zn-binding protein ZnuA